MEPTGSEEVKIPKLTPNGQNWKIYRAKVIEAAATDITNPLGVLAGWELDDGSHDWECRDAILKWSFYTTVPISILCPIRKLDTTHKVFKYLAKRFRDNDPIPRANELQRVGTAVAAETPENYPTSANAATEQHANAKLDEEDLSTTKNLSTQGTEDPVRAEKLRWRAIVLRAQMGHWSYLQARRMKRETNHRTRCERHHRGCQLRVSPVSASRRRRIALRRQDA